MVTKINYLNKNSLSKIQNSQNNQDREKTKYKYYGLFDYPETLYWDLENIFISNQQNKYIY